MEPITTTAENLELNQDIADTLEYIMQDFNKFREKITLINSDGAINYEELVDLYIAHGHGSDNSDVSQSTQDQFTDHLQELNKEITDPLEYIMQDFNKFREKKTLLNSNGDINYEELVDLYITHGSDNSDVSQSARYQFTELLQDFNKFENTMLPPYQVESNNMQDKNDLNETSIETQDSETMVKEMTGVTFIDTRGSCPHTFPSVNITSRNDSDRENVIRYSNMTCYGANCGGEILWGPFVKHFGAQGGGCRTNFFTPASTSTSRRKRIKRKYKGVIETEEETRWRLEQAKIKNREATAKAQAKRKAREATLWTQYLKLRHKNEFRKKLIMFLESHKRINLPPKSFRRTISGPI